MSDLTVFLDTCALLYLASGSEKLSDHAVKLIDNAKVVFVSPITAWEISLKVIRRQLKLPCDPESWFDTALTNHHLDLYPLSHEVLMKANRLPWHHRDPADRFIIASAVDAGAVLVTTDDKFKEYDIELVR